LFTVGEVDDEWGGGFLFMTGAPGMAKCAVAPASAMAMLTAILIFAVFMSALGPSFILWVIVAHAFALDENGVLYCSNLKMGRSWAQLLVITVTSSLSRVCFVHCVGVVIAVIFKQISLS
jgi:hypothetical protein